MSTRAVALTVAAPVPVLSPVQRPTLQRSCDCGQHTGGGECEECKKKKGILQRHSNEAGGPAIAPPIVHEVLRTPGRPLDAAMRSFFEPRFGYNFSGVRLHTDRRAAASAREVNAFAYTVGKDIVFGEGQFVPGTPVGQELLAHELIHVMQQGSLAKPTVQNKLEVSQANDASEREADSVARAVRHEKNSARFASQISGMVPVSAWQLPHLFRKQDQAAKVPNKKIDDLMKKIHDKLTSFLFNLFVGEKDVHEVLLLLKPLSPNDLLEVVERMEDDGLVDRLFKHVSDNDKESEADTLQRIQNVRVQAIKTGGGATVKVQGSCSISDKKAIEGKVDTTKQWAKKAKDAVDDFASDPGAHPAMGSQLDKYFFHQQNNTPLTMPAQKSKAETIRDNFAKVEVQANPIPNECASPVDTECSAMAAAYVNAHRTAVRFCRSFFSNDAKTQTYMLFHELTHVYANVRDRGYGDERVFAHLAPDDAINNADSYALLATDLNGVAGGAASVRGPAPKDNIEDCDPAQKKMVEHDFAYGSRMITRARGTIGDTTPSTKDKREKLLTDNFKTADAGKLSKVRDQYQKLGSALAGPINFECERRCDAGRILYYRRFFGTTVHICPSFFNLSAQDQIDTLLTGVVAEELGLKSTARTGTAGYAKQSTDEAIDNADSYSGYARDATKLFGI